MIGIVNESTLVSRADAEAMVRAVHMQVELQFATSWSRLPSRPKLFASRAEVPAGVPILALVDDSDQAGALGYHTEDWRGRVSGIVAAQPVLDAGGEILRGELSVSAVLSHEVLETHVDPWVDVWVDAPNGLYSYAFEVCDPVQADAYEIDGVSVSNFVLPQWFNWAAPAGTKVDWLGKAERAFALSPGGYAVVRVLADGSTKEIGLRPAWKRSACLSRSTRRVSSLSP